MKRSYYFILIFLGVITFYFSSQVVQDNDLEINNQVTGALIDSRTDQEIAIDIADDAPVVDQLVDWLELGPNKVDLKGWDDDTLSDGIAKVQAAFDVFIGRIKSQYSEQAELQYRTKALESLIGKLKTRNREGVILYLEKVKDLGGARLIFDESEQMWEVAQELQANEKVVELKDYVSQPKASGYRSIHLLIESDGFVFEVQLRTRGMHLWNDWSHDFFYKDQHHIRERIGDEAYQELLDYQAVVAQYIDDLEKGLEPESLDVPESMRLIWDLATEKERELITPQGIPKFELLN